MNDSLRVEVLNTIISYIELNPDIDTKTATDKVKAFFQSDDTVTKEFIEEEVQWFLNTEYGKLLTNET